MNILILWRGLPNPTHPSFARPFYFINYYSSIDSITLISPYYKEERIPIDTMIEFEGVEETIIRSSLSKKAIFSLLGRLTLTNLRHSKDFNFFKLYLPNFQRRVNEVLEKNRFDIIYCDYFVYSYLFNLKLWNWIKSPIILEFFSPILYSRISFMRYGSLIEKIRAFSEYLSFRFFEVKRYKIFEAGIYVSKTHLELSKPFLPKRCYVIPPGIDLDFFKPSNSLNLSLGHPSVLFIGKMSYAPNVHAVLHFYSKIYPYIKREIPNIKFYVVGRNPDKRIKRLSSDPSVIVTGTVEDVRPYFSKAEVFVNPIILDDGGIKTKVLEAMAMGKAVVSTPLGVRDIGVTDYENTIIAKNDKEFAEKVVELLKDENERKRIGRNARKFVEENYSWEKQSKELYNIFKELVEGSFDESNW